MREKELPRFEVCDLSEQDTQELIHHSRFNSLHPESCDICWSEGPFERRVFEVKGVPPSKRADERTQAAIASFFSSNRNISYVFFKTHEGRYYVDSAVCSNCQSSRVVFDIDFDEGLFSTLANASGRPSSEVAEDLQRTAKTITKARNKRRRKR